MKKLILSIILPLLCLGRCEICERLGTEEEEKPLREKCEACGKLILDRMELGQVTFARDGLKICESITIGFDINPSLDPRIVCRECLDEWRALVRPSNLFIQSTFDAFVRSKKESKSKPAFVVVIDGKEIRPRSQEELIKIIESAWKKNEKTR